MESGTTCMSGAENSAKLLVDLLVPEDMLFTEDDPTGEFALKMMRLDAEHDARYPEERKPGYMVQNGLYSPEQLGIYAKDIHTICVGECWFRQSFRTPSGREGVAHTHSVLLDNDEYTSVMCFLTGAYIFSSEGVLDDTFIHEYCHVLRGLPEGHKYMTQWEKETWDGHDVKWGRLAEKYGLIPTRYTPYKYV